MELSLLLSNDSGAYQAILGRFLETAVAETLADRILAQQAAAAAQASATAAGGSASQAGIDSTAAAASEAAAALSAQGAHADAMAATQQAASATASAATATTEAAAASGSATAAAGSATAAAASAAQAAGTLANALMKADNLSDVANAAQALENLGGVTSADVEAALGSALQKASNLSDVADKAAALANIGGIGANQPTINQPVIMGRTDGSVIPAGAIGEYLEVTAPNVNMPSATTVNAAQLTLEPGVWDVTGVIEAITSAGTPISHMAVAVSLTSATLPDQTRVTEMSASGALFSFPLPVVRFSFSVQTTVFGVVRATVAGGIPGLAVGFLRATRAG